MDHYHVAALWGTFVSCLPLEMVAAKLTSFQLDTLKH